MSGRVHAISMPKWGMTMTEGTVAGWLAEEGDAVSSDQDVIEIETTKITNVMEAHATGVLRRRLVGAGATVPVGTLLGVVAQESVADDELDAFIASFTPTDVAAADAGGGAAPRLIETGAHAINVLTMGTVGPPMVLLHGFGGDLNSWLFNQPVLAEDHVVHAFDLPGHGGSSLEVGSGSVPDLAETVVAAADAMGISKAHFVGHSLGGAIALYLGLRKPERVASATLVCPGGLGPEINMEFISGFVEAERRKAMKTVLGLLFARTDAVTRQMVEEALMYKRLDGVPEALNRVRDANFAGDRQAGGMRANLDALSVPVQVIWGRDDAVIPAVHAQDLPGSIAVHVIDDAGHMPHMEHPRAFNGLVAAFVRETEGSSHD